MAILYSLFSILLLYLKRYSRRIRLDTQLTDEAC
jgi:hypothetical protein